MPDYVRRTCVACRTVSGKRNLLRVVRSPDGQVRLDPSGKAEGRGAYVCASIECVEKALKKRLLEGSLRATLPEMAQKELRARVENEVN